MTAPPDWIVSRAEIVATRSPCAKSRRGVVLFDRVLELRRQAMNGDDVPANLFGAQASLIVVSDGWNRPAAGFDWCDGSDRCKATCSKRCVHAEMMALSESRGIQGLDLLHVKIGDDKRLVGGGGPSCWQCSRLISESSINGVWLYEINGGAPAWRYYTVRAFHEATFKACGIHPFPHTGGEERG